MQEVTDPHRFAKGAVTTFKENDWQQFHKLLASLKDLVGADYLHRAMQVGLNGRLVADKMVELAFKEPKRLNMLYQLGVDIEGACVFDVQLALAFADLAHKQGESGRPFGWVWQNRCFKRAARHANPQKVSTTFTQKGVPHCPPRVRVSRPVYSDDTRPTIRDRLID